MDEKERKGKKMKKGTKNKRDFKKLSVSVSYRTTEKNIKNKHMFQIKHL